jgi:carboxylesterase type B
LNITTPAGANERSNLPVLIYIHGGGGFSGSNGDWWTDGGSIVKRSTEIAKPVVAVAIKYVFPLERDASLANSNKQLSTLYPRIHWL